MLRSTLISLILAVMFACVFYALALSDEGDVVSAQVKNWGPGDVRIAAGLPLQRRGSTAVQLDAEGQGVLQLEASGINLNGLGVMQLRFSARPEVQAMVIAWRSDAQQGRAFSKRVSGPFHKNVLADFSRLDGWQGTVSTIALVLQGSPGTVVALDSVSLLPRSFRQTLRLAIAEWRRFAPWSHSAINVHSGVSKASDYPFPLLAAALVVLISVVMYAVGTALGRRGFDWRVPGLLVLIIWLGLDSLWYQRLLRQSEMTSTKYSGLSNIDRRLASDDGALYAFVESARGAIGEPYARLFVTSESDYQGMRGAYFAYPQNVYWEREAKTLPSTEFIRPGDYLMLLRPVRAAFDRKAATLRYGDDSNLTVQLLMSNDIGALFRVR